MDLHAPSHGEQGGIALPALHPVNLAVHEAGSRRNWRQFDRWRGLGPVLCLWPPGQEWNRRGIPAGAPWPGHAALLGMIAARSVQAEIIVDSYGVHEWIWFDGPGSALGLSLLPDSDFYVWSRLLQTLPEIAARHADPARGYGWNATVGCVEQVEQCGGSALLLRTPARLSAAGEAVAHSAAGRRGASFRPA